MLRRAKTVQPTLKSLTKAGNLTTNKSSAKPLSSLYSQPISVRALTSMFVMPSASVRNYSGRDARRAQRQASQVQVKERESESSYAEVVPHKEKPATSFQQHEEPHQNYEPEVNYRDPNVTSEELLNTSVMAHLRKVYTLVGAAAGVAALGGAAGVALGVGGGLAMLSSLGALGTMIYTIFADRSKVLLRQNLLLGTAALIGMGAAPLLGIASIPSILMALGGTGAIFAGFSLAALKAPSGTYLKFGGMMTGAVLVLLAATLVYMLGPLIGLSAAMMSGLYNLNIYGGLVLMSLFVAFDTQQMIDRAASGDTDHVSDALNMFIDIWGIFIRLLAIFNNND